MSAVETSEQVSTTRRKFVDISAGQGSLIAEEAIKGAASNRDRSILKRPSLKSELIVKVHFATVVLRQIRR